MIEYGPHLRRLRKIIKKNHKYVNATLVEDGYVKEPITCEEAF